MLAVLTGSFMNSYIYCVNEYLIVQIVFGAIIIAAVFFMIPIIPGLAVVGILALAFFMYKRWRSKH